MAVANHIAAPVPIMKAASIRPASRNILVCRAFISFRLTSSGFQVLGTHDADTDTGTDSAQTNDQASGQCNKAYDNVFHDNSLVG